MADSIKFKEDKPAFSIGNMDWNKTGSWRYMRPLYEDKLPPCTAGCPTGEKIPQYFAYVKEKKYAEAWYIILEDNPLPGVCGRICYHPCEPVCNRLEFDEAIAINHMERFVADQNRNNSFPEYFYARKNGKKIAIIGSGPSGLSAAYQFARKGYAVTIYEAEKEAGGMLRIGIPSYRLPREIIDKEINDIKSLGVKIITNSLVGENVTWKELADGYDAVLIATGAYKNRHMKIPGEDLPGISSGLEFLSDYNLSGTTTDKRRIVVVGGGNTAIDTARSAVRMGAEVTVVYRRSRAEMPAVPEEIHDAELEGVIFHYLTNPVEFIGNGRIEKIRFIKMKLGEPDESGRRRPVPIPGSDFEMEADEVMLAIGEMPDLEILPDGLNGNGGRIAVDNLQRTNLEGIYACGDVSDGPIGTVVDAIATGKKAAFSIHQMLSREKADITPNEQESVKYDDIKTVYFTKEKRPVQKQNVGIDVLGNYSEVNQGISEEEAVREADRCFSCGTCTFCDLCLIYCPDVAILRPNNDKEYVIDYDFCKGCGLCVYECPRDAMLFEEELKWQET